MRSTSPLGPPPPHPRVSRAGGDPGPASAGFLPRLLAAILVLVSVAAAQASRPFSRPATSSRPSDPLRTYLTGLERFGFSGSVLVAKGGKVLIADGFGFADRAKKIRNTKDTLFEIASATKSFTGVAILQLEAAGKLSCGDQIMDRLPGVPDAFTEVKVFHLLTHTSGMSRSSPTGSGDDLEAAVKAYLSAKPVRKPGAAYEYWNGGYALLAGIVERATKGSYMDWCKKHVFEPAGMKSSGFTGDSLPAARVAIGYDVPGTESRRADAHPYGSYGWQYRGMGGLVTSVEDFYRFDRALKDDTLLPAKARSKLFAPFLEGYACGFQVSDKPKKKIGHGGSVRGFHCQFSRYPDDDACIIVLCNGVMIPPFVVDEALQSIALGGTSRYAKPPPTVDWSAEKLEALAGAYEASPEERLVVRIDDGKIIIGAEGPGSLREIATTAFGSVPEAADPSIIEAARTIVRGVAEGDVGPLRERVASGIPSRWPDDVKSQIWPERIAGLGPLSTIRFAGSARGGTTTTLLFALDFEKGCVHATVGFSGDRLQKFDLRGADFLAEAYAAPSPDGSLARFAWQGKPPKPIAVIRDNSGKVAALKIGGPGTSRLYERLITK